MKSHIVICGAGIAGIATAYYLSRKYAQQHVLLVDRGMPMSLTTSKSGENFRRDWPHPVLRALISRSIDLMQELAALPDNKGFALQRTGYDFVSHEDASLLDTFGVDETDAGELTVFSDAAQIRGRFPYLSPDTCKVVRVCDAGSMDVNALGTLLLSSAIKAGVSIKRVMISKVQYEPGHGFLLSFSGTSEPVRCEKFVLAAGPFNSELALQLGHQLPLQNFLQHKIVIPDPASVIPRDMPFTILADAQQLTWSAEEKQLISEQPELRYLLDSFPAGLHIKPEGSDQIKLGWAYNRSPSSATWSPPTDDHFASVVLRGASRFIPALKQYTDSIPTPLITYSGQYTRTADNLPMIGALDPGHLFLVGGLSGYGTMAACGAGELCAAIISGDCRASYMDTFDPRLQCLSGDENVRDPAYMDGQL